MTQQKYESVEQYVDRIYKQLYPRERAVVDTIKEDGCFVKYDLNKYGLDEAQGPRAVKDLEERGVPIERLGRVNVPQARGSVMSYAFGNPAFIDDSSIYGRQTSVYSLRNKMIAAYGPYCVFCGKKLSKKELQIDHKLPVKYFGELPVKERDKISNYQLVCRSCNKAKEKAIERGCAKTCFKTHDMKTIKSCYWYDPTHCTHVCMKPYTTFTIQLKGTKLKTLSEKLKTKAEQSGTSIQELVVNAIGKELK